MGYQTTSKVTGEERSEVLLLRQEGRSIRAIAAEVFGDVRYRGRVERILASGEGATASLGSEPVSLDSLATVEAIRVLYERRLAMLIAPRRRRRWRSCSGCSMCNGGSTRVRSTRGCVR